MYTEYYGLAEKPFVLTPNPRFAFHSDNYRNSLDQLLYGLEQKEGFILFTGMVGTGKTTLCRDLLEHMDRRKYRTALVFNPFLNGTEMLQVLLTEFGCSYSPELSKKDLLDRLNRYLLSQLVNNYTCVAVFDEAQHLSPEFLEQIRVLSNLETASEKLLQIVLVGQPELRQKIEQPSLAQLDQRVSLRLTLKSLDLDETQRYIYHRLNVAGAQGRIQFTTAAIRQIYQASGGVPRLINLIADRTLLAGFVAQMKTIGIKQVKEGISALRGDSLEANDPPRLSSRKRQPVTMIGAVLASLAIVAVVVFFWISGGLP